MEKITLNIDVIEAEFNIELERNKTVLGLDTASKTGYCVAHANTEKITLDIGYFNIDTKEIKDRKLRNELKYQYIYENLESLIKSEYKIVIENVYHGINPLTTIMLARIGGIAYAIARNKGILDNKFHRNILWLSAGGARKELGLKGNAKKEDIFEEINGRLNLNITSHDEVDAFVLAICGLKRSLNA